MVAADPPLYLGAKSPGQENEANWIPAPAGHFSLMLRLYWPEASVLNGKWLAPEVKKVNGLLTPLQEGGINDA